MGDPNQLLYPTTKRKLLDAALQLMLSKGYTATKVDEICQAANVTKGSFFYYFKKKEDIAKETLEYFTMLQQESMRKSGVDNAEDPWDKVQKHLDFHIFIAKNPEIPNSCLAGNLAQELAYENQSILGKCEMNFSENARIFKKYLDEAKQKYAPEVELNTQSLAEWFVSIFQGSLIVSKAKQNPDVVVENIEHFRNYLHIIFNKSQSKNNG